MNLSELQSIKNVPSKRRAGRGASSGRGGTSGRGNKGHNARTGTSSKLHFEGGQQAFTSRIPKLKGFTMHKIDKYLIINLENLVNFEEKGAVTKKKLLKNKTLRRGYKLKILGNGELKKALTVEADAFSKSAQAGIEKAGGKAVLTEIKKKTRR